MKTINIKKYEDLSDLEKLSLVDFSYSRIDTYTQCPAKYFFSYIKREERQFNPPAVLGNIVHAVLENVLENDKELVLSELQNEYDTNIPLWDPNNLISKELLDIGSVIITDFYEDNMDESFHIYGKEIAFELIIGSYKIIGFIDRVDVYGDNVLVTDYKTGKWEVTNKDVPTNLQLGLYALAMSTIFPDKTIRAELYYLRSGKKKGHTFSQEDIENVKLNLIDKILKIINDKNFVPTNNVRACSYCDHAKTEVCATGVYRNRNKKY